MQGGAGAWHAAGVMEQGPEEGDGGPCELAIGVFGGEEQHLEAIDPEGGAAYRQHSR